jgi:hypothetical protein
MIWLVAALALFVGLALGFVLRKQSSAWCRTCGASLTCSDCLSRVGR